MGVGGEEGGEGVTEGLGEGEKKALSSTEIIETCKLNFGYLYYC